MSFYKNLSLTLLTLFATTLPALSEDTSISKGPGASLAEKAAIVLENEEPIYFKNANNDIDDTHIRRHGGNALRFHYSGNVTIFDAANNDAFQIRNSVNVPVFQVNPIGHAYFLNTGNVGVGTITPDEKLEVNGNIKLSGNIVSDGDICIGSGCL